MRDPLKFDVFVSHSSRDKPIARALAERLQADGLTVWFDEWEIQPGDMIGLKVEQGLAASRTLLLLMSAAAFGSEWVTLERHTALFRDPTNLHRRFVPMRIDDAPLNEMIRQFAYVDWRARDEGEYQRLLKVCRVVAHHDERLADSGMGSSSLRPAALQALPEAGARQPSLSYFPRPSSIAFLANVLIFLSLGVFLWSRNEPQPNVPVIEVVSTERFSPRSASQTVNAIHLDKSTRKVIILLAVDEELLGFASYRFILTGRGDRKIWDSQELSPNIGGGYFSVEFPRSYLAAGAYKGYLYGLSRGNGTERLIASYPLEVSHR